MMKGERQRWRPEEDSLLLSYVKQYGPKEWSLIPQRMGQPLDRDPKSCLERWRNYLKPGLKQGSLSPDEQHLLISLQAKYGNKWKKIAAHIPGRTPKRLGKWWEVFKDKEAKQNSRRAPAPAADQGKYDHILDTFAEKYVGGGGPHPPPVPPVAAPSEQICALVRCVEEGRRRWVQHRKEAAWRMRRLEQQLEAEKGRRKREKTEEIQARMRRLREEEEGFRGRAEMECREGVAAAERDCEAREAELMEELAARHVKLAKVVERFWSISIASK